MQLNRASLTQAELPMSMVIFCSRNRLYTGFIRATRDESRDERARIRCHYVTTCDLDTAPVYDVPDRGLPGRPVDRADDQAAGAIARMLNLREGRKKT